MVVPPSTIHNYFNLVGIDENTATWELFDIFLMVGLNEWINSDPNLHTSAAPPLLTLTERLAVFL